MGTKVNIETGVIPLSKFRQSSKTFLKKIKKDGEPLILTQNGESAVVLLAPAVFQKMEYERELFKAISEGEKDFQEGHVISHEALFKELLS